MQTYLCDKMPPKKVKIKKRKKWDLANLENSFFNFNFFWGHFVIKVSLHFWNQHKIAPMKHGRNVIADALNSANPASINLF